MRSGLEIREDKLDAILDALRLLNRRDVLVGIPSDRATREAGAEINNAELGYLHSYGGTIRIPERTQEINRKINPDGTFANGARFVKVSNANYATRHAVKSYTVTLPPRPFLDKGIANARTEIIGDLRQAAAAALEGNKASALQYLARAGVAASNAAKGVIHHGDLDPLSASTLANRRSRGKAGTKPLYDTGSLVRAITYVVRSK